MSRNVATFVGANSERLVLDDPALRYGDENVTLACWARTGAVSAVMGLMGRWGSAGNRSYSLYLDATGIPTFAVSNDGTASTSVAWSADVDDSDWHYLVAIHDAANNLLKISVDGGAFQTQAHTTGIYSASTAEFQIGARGSADFYTGDMASDGAWAKAFSLAQVTALYNGGTPKLHADLTADELVSLTTYWDLTEASGDRNEQGSSTLTKRAAKFVDAQDEYLSSTDNAFSSGGSDVAFAAWVNPELLGRFVASKTGFNVGVDENEWTVDTAGVADVNRAYIWDAIEVPKILTSASSLPLNSWSLVMFWTDHAANKIYLQINEGAVEDEDTSGSIKSDDDAIYMIGRRGWGTDNADWQGLQQAAGFWKRSFTSDDRTELYNGGTPLDYSDLSDTLKTAMVSWHPLNEQSGVRDDAHTSDLDLTDNNTVTYAQAKDQLWLLDVNGVGSSSVEFAPSYEYTGSGGLALGGAAATMGLVPHVYVSSGGVVFGGGASTQRLSTTPNARPGDDPFTATLTASNGSSTLTASKHTTVLTSSRSG